MPYSQVAGPLRSPDAAFGAFTDPDGHSRRLRPSRDRTGGGSDRRPEPVEGIDNIEAGRTYVVVSNHQSAFDIPAQFQAIPIPIRFFAKKELFGIPVFGTALRAIGIVEVDRQAGAAVHGQINAHSAEVVARGHSVLVYAEGTRFQDGPVHPFKRGAFSIAIEAGLPILPAMVFGGHLAWPPKRPILGGPMKVAIGRPIETAGLTRKDIADLRDQTKQAIERMVDSAV